MRTHTYNTQGVEIPWEYKYNPFTLFMRNWGKEWGAHYSDKTKNGDYVHIYLRPEWHKESGFFYKHKASISNNTTMFELEDRRYYEEDDLHSLLVKLEADTGHDILFVKPCDYLLGLLLPKIKAQNRPAWVYEKRTAPIPQVLQSKQAMQLELF